MVRGDNIHTIWNQNVITDKEKKAKIYFYNNSSCKQIFIPVEGITKDGAKSYIYKSEKNMEKNILNIELVIMDSTCVCGNIHGIGNIFRYYVVA